MEIQLNGRKYEDLTIEEAEQLIEFQKEYGLEPCILEGHCFYPDSIYKFFGIGCLLKSSKEES